MKQRGLEVTSHRYHSVIRDAGMREQKRDSSSIPRTKVQLYVEGMTSDFCYRIEKQIKYIREILRKIFFANNLEIYSNTKFKFPITFKIKCKVQPSSS